MKNSKNNNGKKANAKKVNTNNIDLTNLSDEELLQINLDKVNIFDVLEKHSEFFENIKKDNKERMYKDTAIKEGESPKNFRRRIRNTRNKFISNVLYYASNKDTELLKKEIKNFNKFYKETYLKNDYTVNSLARKNSDKETINKIRLFLQVIKQLQ